MGGHYRIDAMIEAVQVTATQQASSLAARFAFQSRRDTLLVAVPDRLA